MDANTLILVFSLLSLDQFVKYFLSQGRFSFTINSGISFGLFAQLPSVVLSLVVVGLLIILSGWFILQKNPSWLTKLYYSLFLAGGLGNLIDRMRWGGAMDYFFLWQLPVFNLADVMITIGFALFVIQSLQGLEKNQ